MNTILVIDDQKDNLTVIQAILKNYMSGCTVHTAESGAEGLELAARYQPDTILLDIIMPGMDGYEVCELLKLDQRTAHIPVIMLTAIKTDTDSRIKGLESGADAFFSKPIEPNELSAQIKVMLRLKEVEDQLREDKEQLERRIKERNRALWESEERYRSLVNDVLDSSSVAMIIINRDHRIVWVNDPAQQLFLIDAQSCIGTEYAELLEGSLCTGITDGSELSRMITGALERGDHVSECDFRMRAAEGLPERWISYRSHPISSGLYRGGRIEQFYDITEIKTTQQLLQQQTDHYQTIFENTGAATIIVDAGNLIEAVNKRFILLSRKPREQLVDAARWTDFIHNDDVSYCLKVMSSLTDDEAVNPFEFRFCSGDRIIRNVLATMKGIPGTAKRVISLLDITGQKQAEQDMNKIQRLESIGTLASGIAHDFNNILTGLFGNITMADLEVGPEHPARAYLQEAEGSLNRAKRLTNQLLTFSKGGEPVKQQLELLPLVEDIVRFDLSGSSVQEEIISCDGLWSVDADRGQIEQVLSNLVINAKESMPDGGHLSIVMENCEKLQQSETDLLSGRFVKIVVRDEGSGIREEDLDRIFDPYFTTKETGNGLGLATVYSIVYKHKGLLQISSEQGRGTEITVYLPAGKDFREAPAAPEKGSEDLLERCLHVLIMDDERIIREIVSTLLKRIGYHVSCAEDGTAAIAEYKSAMLSDDPYDIVLMDLTIPGGMGGKEAVRELLKIDPAAKVVVTSGYADDPIMADPAAYGFSGVAVKPYTMRSLRDTIFDVMQHQSPRLIPISRAE